MHDSLIQTQIQSIHIPFAYKYQLQQHTKSTNILNQSNQMNNQQYPRHIQHHNQQYLYDLTTEDEMKPFKVSELLKNQPQIEQLSDKDLTEYCHNEWKLWMASLLELKKCIENESTSSGRQHDDKKQQNPQPTKPQTMPPYNPPPQPHHSLPQNMLLPPPYYQQSFQQAIRNQNMHYMRMNQPHPSYMPQNRSFPFPYTSELKQNQPNQGYGQGQTLGGRGMMMGQQGQMHGGEMNK